jgi:AraC family transcriptional regulator of adaptative response/methylated-DNA-[protein]-cysteine methyltransferase
MEERGIEGQNCAKRISGTNQLSLIVSCHRVININGELGGYGVGVARKQWLLEHEKNYKRK